MAKKFPSLVKEYATLLEELKDSPQTGTGIGHGCYKIRLAIASKGTGKRGGARVITYVRVINETVYLLAIYDKSEQSSLSDQQVLALLGLLTDE
ncbi:type II toxin-antitoxin system RelE/ParE family toxin [Hymenobacter rubripertinctus]|uniref:type II toxin-antitoxin system RelE/ParE family toxin n=1 Tax=Hymenobacter rubripertinctus TaxID=2029981 RepID=UPI002939203D|nr:type II toxin-antitoxin system RelE/ParE family toxin [Hymenobacter rubripertinctus]